MLFLNESQRARAAKALIERTILAHQGDGFFDNEYPTPKFGCLLNDIEPVS